ncbi:MAG: hypothetical protein ACK5IJ_08075, partial [Mangrovibacterium sp.]
MKKLILSTILLVGAVSIQAQETTEKKTKEVAEVTFKSAIDCNSCEAKNISIITNEKVVKDV